LNQIIYLFKNYLIEIFKKDFVVVAFVLFYPLKSSYKYEEKTCLKKENLLTKIFT